MADSTTTTVLSVCATVNSKVSDLAFKEGQLIFVRDKQRVALDFAGVRRFYEQIEELATEDARNALLAPVTGRYYFVIDTAVLWTYQDGWVQITTSPSDISALETNVKEYADTLVGDLSKRITGNIDTDGNLVLMFNEQFEWLTE